MLWRAGTSDVIVESALRIRIMQSAIVVVSGAARGRGVSFPPMGGCPKIM